MRGWIAIAIIGLSATAQAHGVLPAGIYFRHHTYSTCSGCPAPTSAVIAGVFATERAAGEAAARVPADRLQVGYPLVVHTEELGLADASAEGIVVVEGLFASDAEALRFLDGLRDLLPDARVAPLADAEVAFERLSTKKLNPGSPRRLVVRIAAGPPVPAFDRGQIDAEADQPRQVLDTRRDPKTRAQPICALPPGAIFVAEDGELHHYYEWAPVRCPGGQPAYVRWQSTLLGATIRKTGSGARLRQVIGAECDEPSFGSWRYDAVRGRR
jgi:hypothetical protein